MNMWQRQISVDISPLDVCVDLFVSHDAAPIQRCVNPRFAFSLQNQYNLTHEWVIFS